MKFTVGSQQLYSRLSILSRVIPSANKSGGTSTIINDALFDIQGSVLTMTGTDGETRLSLSLRLRSHEGENGRICIRPENLLLPLKELAAQDLAFDVDFEKFDVNVQHRFGHFEFVGQDAANYPAVAPLERESTKLELPTDIFARGLTYTDYAVSLEDTRPLLTGVHIDLDNKAISFAATDGYMMALYRNSSITIDLPDGESRSITLPGKPVSLIKLLFTHHGDDEEQAKQEEIADTLSAAPAQEINDTIMLTVYVNYATIEKEDMRLQCRLLEGKYPNYESVIPANNDKVLTADRSLLLSALRRVSIFSDEHTKMTNMIFTENSLELDAKNIDYFTAAQEQLPISFTGTDRLEIAFSALHFIRILSILPGEHVEVSLGDRAHPALITPEGTDEEETIIAIVMPLLI